jgi:hypothetical protein
MPTRRRPFVASFSAQRQCRLLQRQPDAAETPEEAADGDVAADAVAETETDVAAETDEDTVMATALAMSRSLVPVPAPVPAPVGTNANANANAGMMTAMNLTPQWRGRTRVRTYGDASPLPASCPTPP